MSRSFATYLVICICTFNASCQEKDELAIGRLAPKININKWLQETPELENKVIVIDFWFTNCAPCVASIPHLNDLVDTYQGEDIVFLAVTDDSKKKVNAFMERRKIDIQSSVGFYSFNGLERKFNVEAFPQSFVIDSEGILRWAGSPLLLSTELIDDILGTNKKEISSQVVEIKKDSQHLLIREARKSNGGTKFDRPSENHVRRVFLGNSLPQFIASLNPISEFRIKMDSSLSMTYYDITFEDYDVNPDLTDGARELTDQVLASLDISMTKVLESREGWSLEVSDSSKLKKHKKIRGGSYRDDSSFEGVTTISNLFNTLEKLFQKHINFDKVENLSYDFELNLSNWDQLLRELETKYGLKLTSGVFEMDIFELSKK